MLKKVSFEEIFKDCTKDGLKIKREDYLKEGLYPIIDQGQEYISGFTNISEGLYIDIPVIIFGDHTRIIKYIDTPFFLGADGVKLLKCKKSNANYKYLYYALKNARIPDTGYNRHFKWLKEIEIPYPSSKEQDNISEILDKISNLISLRKKQIDKLDLLIKSQFVEMFGDPAINEKNWSLVKLDNVAMQVTYGLTVRPEYVEKGIDVVSAREIRYGQIDYNSAPKIKEDDYIYLSDKAKPKKNDILFSKTGSIGHCAIVDDDKAFAVTQNASRITVDLEKVNPNWVLHYLRTDYIQNWCKSEAKGNAVKDFQIQDIKRIPIFECPKDLQNKYVNFVNQIDKQKLAFQNSLKELNTLYNSLMQKYFG